jgi:hypothetical protein
MGPPCNGKTKKTAIATRTSKAPVVWRAYRELLSEGVSWPNRCRAATLMRWLVDGVTRSASIPRSRSYQNQAFHLLHRLHAEPGAWLAAGGAVATEMARPPMSRAEFRRGR